MTLFIDLPTDGFADELAFWLAATGTRLSAFRGDNNQFATLLPQSGDAFLRVQRLDRDGPRVHLDLHVADVEGAAQLAEDLGAHLTFHKDGLSIMQSPAGLEFCFVRPGEFHLLPEARDLGGGFARVDQLCLDVAARHYERECDFWSQLTQWPLRSARRPEFSYLERPATQPARVLLQRRDDDEPRSWCHLDFSCRDVAAEVTRHQALGAQEIGRFESWTAMHSPMGLPYCLTRWRD